MKLLRLLQLCFVVFILLINEKIIAADKIVAIKYLETIGDSFDIYFTIEDSRATLIKERYGRLLRINGLKSSLYDVEIEPIQASTLDEHLQHFSKTTGMLFSCDLQNSKIYRLRDKDVPLFSILDKEFSNFHFNGLLSELFQHEKLKTNIWVDSEGVIGGESGADRYTKLRIDADKISIRSILVNWLPISQYERVLFCANVAVDDALASIWFCRHMQRVENTNNISFCRHDFFELVDKRNQMIHQAIDYIWTSNTVLPQDQTRWAMLLLGEYRATEGIPVLIKKLEYQYANIMNVKEAFPAVSALITIGEPAFEPLINAIALEQKSERFVYLTANIISTIPNIKIKKILKKYIDISSGDIKTRLESLCQEIDILKK